MNPEGGTATLAPPDTQNPLNATLARDRSGSARRDAARAAAAEANQRPISSRGGDKTGVFIDHTFDRRRDQLRNSRQKDQRQQAAPAPGITDDEAIVVSRSALVQDVTTGESMKHRKRISESPVKILGLPIEDRRRPEVGEDVLMTGETVRKTVDFLRTYVSRWNDLARINVPGGGNMLDQILQDPAYYADKALLDTLSTIKGPNIRGVVDDAAFRKFLSTSDAWGETLLAMERFTLLTEMGQGMEATVRHKIYNKQRDDSLELRRITVDEDIKTLRGLIRTGVSNSISTMGALAYYLGPIGRGTTDIEFRYRAEIVKMLKEPPPPAGNGMSLQDRAIFKAFAKIDIDNLGVTVPGLIGAPTIEPQNGTTTFAYENRIAVAQIYTVRKDILVTLGLGEPPSNSRMTLFRDVDRSQIKTLHGWLYEEAQGFHRGEGGRRPEGSALVSDVRVIDEYSRLLREGIATATTAGNPPPGELQRLRYMGQALETVRNRYAQDRVEVERRTSEEKKEADSLAALDTKRTQMDSGEFRQKRREILEKRRDDAKTARVALEARRTTMIDGEGSVGAADKAVQTLASALSRMGVDTTGNVQAAFRARETALDGEINAQIAVLNTLTNNRRIEQMTALTNARNAYNVSQATLPAGIRSNAAFDGAIGEKDAIAERWQPMIDPVNTEIARLQQMQADLRTRYEEYGSAVDKQFEATLSLAYDGERNKLQNAVNARMRLTAATVTLPGAAAAAALTLPDITNRPTQVLIDALRVGPPPVGADDAERLRWVTQAKAQIEQDNARLPTYQQSAVIRLATLPPPNNFTRDALLIRDPNEVINVLRELYANGGLPVDPLVPGPVLLPLGAVDALNRAQAEVAAARLGVSRQLRELAVGTLSAEIDHQQGVEHAAETQVSNLENLEVPKARVDVARAVMRRMADGSLMSEARSLADIPREGAGSREDRLVNQLGNLAAIDPADPGVTEFERNANIQRWVTEWWRFLDPSLFDATNREELMQGFYQNLSPQRMGEIINTEMGPPRVAAGTADFENVVARRFRNRSRTAARRPNQAQIIRIVRAMHAEIRAAGAAV